MEILGAQNPTERPVLKNEKGKRLGIAYPKKRLTIGHRKSSALWENQAKFLPKVFPDPPFLVELPCLFSATMSLYFVSFFFFVTSWGHFGPFQEIFGNSLGPFSGDFRQFQAIFGNFRQFWVILGDFVWGANAQEKNQLYLTKKAEDCTPNILHVFVLSFKGFKGSAKREKPLFSWWAQKAVEGQTF